MSRSIFYATAIAAAGAALSLSAFAQTVTFESLDANKDGLISVQEASSNDDLFTAFKSLDKDKDGAAVEMAEPAGWVRVFIDEGEVIASLIIEAYSQGPELDTPTDRFAVRLVSMLRRGPQIEADEEEVDDFGLTGRLANREVDILTMVSGGLRNREIGDRLGLTEGTVKWYMQQIYDKLGVRRRPQAVLRARQLGILP